MGKSEVYSWRLSRETKAALEDEARRHRTSLASLLDGIVQEWRRRHAQAHDDATEQARLHAAAARSFGRIAGKHPYSAARTREVIRQRLRRARAGS
jgi:hypothetical protein